MENIIKLVGKVEIVFEEGHFCQTGGVNQQIIPEIHINQGKRV